MHFSTHLHAGVDFNASVFDLSFGKSEELIRVSFSTNNDSRAELKEGFLCYLEVIEDQLHPRDVGRIDFFNRLVLVRILDNDGKDVCPVSVKTCSPFNHLPFTLWGGSPCHHCLGYIIMT